ncbi:MAG: glucose-6-phosphate dehydrogenase assembly protein OpcA [Ktedonobacteraceae bacterium]|nr:glucose-6-phosphate dehydrogenase assembly protein OpcA [Chloroflexota bacterium]
MTDETNKALGIRSPWAGKAVRLEQLDEEMTFLWKMSADNMRTSQNIGVRTSVLNLVVCVPTIQSAERASAVLRELASTQVARVVILILDHSANPVDPVSAWLTLRSFPVISDITRHTFEQITVLLNDSAMRYAANIIQPLLKPDLPAYLWWIGDPPADSTAFNRLATSSSRVIVDSATFFYPEQSICVLTDLLQSAPYCALSDLNWERLTPLRQLVAQFFDTAEYRPYLDGIHSIEIAHTVAFPGTPAYTEQGAISSEPMCALLLVGWLKERLGWKFTADTEHNQMDTTSGTYHWRMLSPNKQPALIEIRPQVEPDMPPGSIYLLRLTSRVGQEQAQFVIDRESGPDHAQTSVSLKKDTGPQRVVRLTDQHRESTLLHAELQITGHDHLFEETLHEVAALLK